MPNRQLRIGVVGKDGRTDAIQRSLKASPQVAAVTSLSPWKAKSIDEGLEEVLRNAREFKPDFVVVGPEAPLDAGVVDRLQTELKIPSVGPAASLAKLESSKAFTRELVSRHNIPGNPEYRVFESLKGVEQYLASRKGYVVKPDGLTGGKGVKVSGEHLHSVKDAVKYCEELFDTGQKAIVIEEKLEGEEFSFQSFCDGQTVKDMIAVQDHKRAREGDTGPNTGGMGSYSCPDHSLPFLRPEHIRDASAINAAVARALLKEMQQPYQGILYGGFMVTRNGVRLLEYNARFGDPEALNVLSVMETDFAEVCDAIVRRCLDQLTVRFRPLATVCKYVVPKGYPDSPVKDVRVDVSKIEESDNLRMYQAAVQQRKDGLYLTGSRALAFVGIGKGLEEAEGFAERAASLVEGPVFHRRDIGTRDLIERRVAHVRQLETSPAGVNK